MLKEFRKYRSRGLYDPPSLQGTLVMPGQFGGGNWSGGALDPRTGWLYINTNEIAVISQLRKADVGSDVFYFKSGPRFRDQNEYPGNKPPWGKLVAIDLGAGEIMWEKPLGEYAELTAKGIPITGQENIGGATATAGGLLFIASTPDKKFRAFDLKTGETVWETVLDAPGYAAPVSYAVDGKQYVVICAGGGHKHGLVRPIGDSVIAYALEE